jgi:hypothetical protein
MYNGIYAGGWVNFVEGGTGSFVNAYAAFDCTLNTLGGVRGPIFGDFRIVVIDEPLNIRQSTAVDKNFLFVSWSIFSRLLYVKNIWATRYRRWII